MSGKIITIHDVARIADVSSATVSRYLNGTAKISEQKRISIENAIKQLDFQPNPAARSLKSRRTYQVMLVVPDICNPFYATMYKTVQDKMLSKGYSVSLFNTNEDLEQELKSIKLLSNLKFDGVIFFSINYCEEIVSRLKNLDIPVASPYFDTQISDSDGVPINLGTFMAAKHLIELNHKNIVYVGGPRNSYINVRRRNGYIKAMHEAGLSFDEKMCFEMDFTIEAGYRAGKYLTTFSPMPTAVCAANDLIAFGALMALNEHGVKIPDDISITGVDDIEFTKLTKPALTTVNNNPEGNGQFYVETLFEKMDGTKVNENKEDLLACNLIVRESTRKI